MNLGIALHTFVSDTKVHVLLLVIAVDLALGIIAAVKTKTFKLSYISQFMHDDVLSKVVPYFVLYFAALVAGNQTALIPGLDLGVIAGGAYALIIAAMVGSIIGSLKSLGITVPATVT